MLERTGLHKRWFRIHLPDAFPNRDRQWHRQTYRIHLQHRFHGACELIRTLWADPVQVTAQVQVIGWPQLIALQNQRVPVILLAGHFVGLPLTVRALAERVPLRVVARMFRPPLFQHVLTRLARRTGGGLIDGADGRAICRSLKQGETILILADYGMADDVRSAARNAIYRLAQRSGSVVLPLHYLRQGKAYRLYVGMPLSAAELTAEGVQSLYLTWIEQWPAEYLWPRIRRTSTS